MTSGESTRFLDTLGLREELPATDDVLARIVPLFEQVASVHERGLVAPLDGIDALASVGGRLFFAEREAMSPRDARTEVERASPRPSGAVRVVDRLRRDDDGVHDLSVGSIDQAIDRPVYLPAFVAWEHRLGHHDALTDIFVLGLVGCAVALDAPIGDAEKLPEFVAARRGLTRANPRLHPVVARVLEEMTELDRRSRPQDLATLIETLRTYREQRIDDALDLDSGERDRVAGIHRRLRERLFDFSRRNRLLYFRPTANTVDLTATSVPLVLDVANVDPDSLFAFRGRASKDVVSQKSIPLARYVKFEDYPFVAPALDALRLEARRSRAELGFSQLRLAICFLHWTDLREDASARISSPLLLVPVELEKRKGVRDVHSLTATDDEAEVNPVLRQFLRQRYGIALPERVDLGVDGAIDALHAQLGEAIRASEPAVVLEKVDAPRIDLVLAAARRRLDAYRRKVRLSGRSVRTRGAFDYAYGGATPHPLGVQLFHAHVRPAEAPDREVAGEAPQPRVHRIAAGDELTRELYARRDAASDAGPYHWILDLASVTLANFNYRNVSLVRDYAAVLDDGFAPSEAFAGLFRDDARPIDAPASAPPLHLRHDVVLADPTQAEAVARARKGASYVIQGPPGTGKSQTITNLIADFAAQGKRVLFVCEKRAALDVVHHRLAQVGLAQLASIIHDAQDDKRAFLADLKATYETWLADPSGNEAASRRTLAAARVEGSIARANRVASAMLAPPLGSDASFLEVVRRAVELRDVEVATVEGTMPSHRATRSARAHVEQVESLLAAFGATPRLGAHPVRFVGATLLGKVDDRETTRASLAAIRAMLARIRAVPALVPADPIAARTGVVLARHALASLARDLLVVGLSALLDVGSSVAVAFRARAADLDTKRRLLGRAEDASRGWTDPPGMVEASAALAVARPYEANWFGRIVRWLAPGWWRVRALVRARFDLAAQTVQTGFVPILEALVARHRASIDVDDALVAFRAEFADQSPESLRARLNEITRLVETSPGIDELRAAIARGEPSCRAATDAARETSELPTRLADLVAWEELDVGTLESELARLERELHVLPKLAGPLLELDRASPDVAAFLRRHDLRGIALEAAVVRRSIAETLRERAPDLARDEGTADAAGEALRRAAAELFDANAAAIVAGVRRRFVERAQQATASLAGLAPDEKDRRRAYANGRRELEREFSKVMRHKTIRELVSGPSSPVVLDLKPVWLMSPLSVADVLPLAQSFDVVIFDEASQIPLEDAVPAIHRAPQCIVVGDRQQLPPTDFFSSGASDEDDDATNDSLARELDADSLLTHADRTLPSTMLGWHYRSRDESLIDFSNQAFYDGRLSTVPSVAAPVARDPIVVDGEPDGDGARLLLERPISFHRLANGVYVDRKNVAEARYIAEMIRALLMADTRKTLGIVAFSEAQQGAIERAIDALAESDAEFRSRYERECTREDEGQFVGLFVKNLENVQGDERDVIIVSVCYAPDTRGRMIMNFGPINRRGGERRLNVIFSRAKHHVAVVSSIGPERITNDYNEGAACLKAYLAYADAVSRGDVVASRVTLDRVRGSGRSTRLAPEPDSVVEAIAVALRARGLDVATDVGASKLRVDLAVRRAGEASYRVAVLVDTPGAYAQGVDETMRMKPGVLRAFGWTPTMVETREWHLDPAAVVARIEAHLHDVDERVNS